LGLTVEDFDSIVKLLVSEGWCSLKVGGQGGTLVVLNEQPSNVPEVPVSA
jgi:hypothetical protein